MHWRDRVGKFAKRLGLLSLLFVAVLLLQSWLGAFATERINYSDEGAHFMNGLLLRDYLRQGFPGDPIRFAEQYYLSYPKVAPLMWPPLFHLVLGVLMLGGSPQIVALLLVAFATAWTAWRLHDIASRLTSPFGAVVAVGLFLGTSVVINLTTSLMLDMVVAAFALESVHWFARFATEGRRYQGAVFGLLVAAACLTKGNGLAGILLPPIFILLTGRFDLLRSAGLWIAALIVLICAGPLVAYSLRLDARIGDFGGTGPAWALAKAVAGVTFLSQQFGPVASICVGAGIVVGLWNYWFGRERSASSHVVIALASLMVAVVAIHALTPLRVIDSRYFAMAVAPGWALLMVGCSPLMRLRQRGWRRTGWAAVVVLVATTFAAVRPAVAARAPSGYRDLASWLQSQDRVSGKRLLILSDEMGEGAFVSEIAVGEPSLRPTIVRGTKLLATDDWNGHNFTMVFSSATALERELKDLHIDTVIVDEALAPAYAFHVRRLFYEYPDTFRQVHEVRGKRRLVVFELTSVTPGDRKPVRVTISATGQVLQTAD